MKLDVRACVAGWVLAMGALGSGCKGPREERCREAQRRSASAWQAYEVSARDAVNHADEDATAAARAAVTAGARAQASAEEASGRLTLADLVPESTAADAGAGHAVPVAVPGTPPVTAGAIDPARRAQLIAARSLAQSIVEIVRDVGRATQDLGASITTRDDDGAHAAALRADDGARRAQASAVRIAQTVTGPAGADPVSQALARVSQTAQALSDASAQCTRAAATAIAALATSEAALVRANAALAASGAAFRNPVQARNAARAVPEDPAQSLFVRARTASDESWGSCVNH